MRQSRREARGSAGGELPNRPLLAAGLAQPKAGPPASLRVRPPDSEPKEPTRKPLVSRDGGSFRAGAGAKRAATQWARDLLTIHRVAQAGDSLFKDTPPPPRLADSPKSPRVTAIIGFRAGSMLAAVGSVKAAPLPALWRSFLARGRERVAPSAIFSGIALPTSPSSGNLIS